MALTQSQLEKSRRYYAKNPERYRAANKRWIENNREKYKQTKRRAALRKYGLTPESYEELWLSQNHACAICGSKTPGDPKGWHIDHCHKSNVARGILCCHCNRMLGGALDRIETLMSGISYLKTATRILGASSRNAETGNQDVRKPLCPQ